MRTNQGNILDVRGLLYQKVPVGKARCQVANSAFMITDLSVFD